MNVKTRRKNRMCRFCLQHGCLIGLSKVIGSAFNFEDVVYYTGILISENEEVTICNACCVAISNSVNFRRTCLSNDIIFKKLASVVEVNVPAIDSSIVIDSDSQHSTEDNELEEGARNDTGIITMDYTDSDDLCRQEESKQEIVESHANERLKKSSTDISKADQLMSAIDEKKKIIANATDSKQHNLRSLEGIDDLMSSSPGVAVRVVALNDKITSINSSAPAVKHLPNDTLRGQTTLARRPYAYRSSKTSDDSDSNDSVISLYSEVMAKAKKELLEARRAELQMQRSMMHAVKSRTPPGGDSELESKEKQTDLTEANLKTLDDAGSDDSMDSLYKVQNSIKVKKKPFKPVELCPYCGTMTAEWLNHVNRTHIKKMRYSCPHCPKQFGEKFVLREHVNTAHEKRILYTCELCGKGFVCTGSHYYHMTNVHGKQDVYECETCHRKLRSFDGYKKHLKIHSITSIPCPHCDKVFKTAETLEKHRRRYHSS